MTDKERHDLLGKIEDEVSAALNLKFTILSTVPKEEIRRLQNQKVMDVEEYDEANHLGEFKAWKGSTEMAYFYIIFSRGVLTVVLEEREMLIGSRITTYATLTKLAKMAKTPEAVEWFTKYNLTGYQEDIKNVTFGHVMTTLKWKLHSKKVKVKKGMTFSP